MIAALNRQTLARAAPLTVVILLNNTSDNSKAVLHRLAGRCSNLVIVVEDAGQVTSVGLARKLAMEAALDRIDDASAVVLTTDADAKPRQDWVEANLCALARGADVATGLVLPDEREEALLGRPLMARRLAFHDYMMLRDMLASVIDPIPHDPWPRHPYEMAGSLCVRGGVYHAVGGMEPLSYREDLAFVSKARSLGYRVRHSPHVLVNVSARIAGRVCQGMATSLGKLKRDAEEGRPLLVEDPAVTVERLRCRRYLRLHGGDDFGPFGSMPKEWLIETFLADDPDAADVPLETAVAALRGMVEDLHGVAESAGEP